MILKLFIVFSPWFIKRRLLKLFFGYKLATNAKIGLSWIFPDMLIMEEGSSIGHLNIAIHLDKVELKKMSKIGRGNWITGLSTKSKTDHFTHQIDRKPELSVGAYAAITKNHHLDCTNHISIGKYSTIAGYSSQFLSHSINIEKNYQDSAPIIVGDYTFVSTNVVILGGAVLPSYSVLGAKSLLNKTFEQKYMLYGGVPAKPLKEISQEALYFSRKEGFVK